MVQALKSKDEYSYRVDVARCVQELETGIPLEQIKLSDYPTLTRVSIFDAQEVCNEEYRVEEVQGKLYRFCYRRTVQYGSIWKLDLVLGVLWICTAAFLILLGRKLVRPFASMEGLTTELAKGNLSVPIKAEKSRFFGKFLWSLDMLREKLEADKLRRLELEKEKKTLLLSLSHDIRTPLSAIELYTQALEENLYENEEKRQQAIGGIRKNTETIKKYVGEISEAAREDFLKLDVHQGEFYLSQMMQALKLYYKEKFADLHTDFQMESFADCLLYGDLDRAVEVGQNVLENAIKYGDGKYVHISFSEDEDHSLITIENSGDGLKEEELPQSWADMESYIDKNPKKFGYSDPNGGSSGNAFIQRALVYINGDYDYRTDKIDEAQIANWKKTWDWFSSKKDALIRTASNADSLTRLNDGELVIVSAWQDHLFSLQKQGAITDRLKFYVPKFGMPGGGNVVTVAKNAPNPAASLVFVHWITSPEVQQKLNQEFGVRPLNSESGLKDTIFFSTPWRKAEMEAFTKEVISR